MNNKVFDILNTQNYFSKEHKLNQDDSEYYKKYLNKTVNDD